MVHVERLEALQGGVPKLLKRDVAAEIEVRRRHGFGQVE